MSRTACTESQCLYKGALYITFQTLLVFELEHFNNPACYSVSFNLPLPVNSAIFYISTFVLYLC